MASTKVGRTASVCTRNQGALRSASWSTTGPFTTSATSAKSPNLSARAFEPGRPSSFIEQVHDPVLAGGRPYPHVQRLARRVEEPRPGRERAGPFDLCEPLLAESDRTRLLRMVHHPLVSPLHLGFDFQPHNVRGRSGMDLCPIVR